MPKLEQYRSLTNSLRMYRGLKIDNFMWHIPEFRYGWIYNGDEAFMQMQEIENF